MLRKNLHRRRKVNHNLDKTMSQIAKEKRDEVSGIISSYNGTQSLGQARITSPTPRLSVINRAPSSDVRVRKRSLANTNSRPSLRRSSQSEKEKHRDINKPYNQNRLPALPQAEEAPTQASGRVLNFRPSSTRRLHPSSFDLSQASRPQGHPPLNFISPISGNSQPTPEFSSPSCSAYFAGQSDVLQRTPQTCPLNIINAERDGVPVMSKNNVSLPYSTIFASTVNKLRLGNKIRPSPTTSSCLTQHGLIPRPYKCLSVTFKTAQIEYIEDVTLIVVEGSDPFADTENNWVYLCNDFWRRVYTKRNLAATSPVTTRNQVGRHCMMESMNKFDLGSDTGTWQTTGYTPSESATMPGIVPQSMGNVLGYNNTGTEMGPLPDPANQGEYTQEMHAFAGFAPYESSRNAQSFSKTRFKLTKHVSANYL
ncbi:hypothetical protein F4779DRAFT_313484 [Xylariaceae sp. FL0662B]|nr:hypothetical protein F4779DRAFT_313484 [Xylariaceae sp. FL0662B]